MRQYRKGDKVRATAKGDHGFSLNTGKVGELYKEVKPKRWRVHTGSGFGFVDESDMELLDPNDIQQCTGFIITSTDRQWEINGDFNLDKRKLESLEEDIRHFWKYEMGAKVDVRRKP